MAPERRTHSVAGHNASRKVVPDGSAHLDGSGPGPGTVLPFLQSQPAAPGPLPIFGDLQLAHNGRQLHIILRILSMRLDVFPRGHF